MTPFVEKPPQAPLPEPEENAAWYGEFWLLYPQSPSSCSMKFGQLFKARCELALLAHRISVKVFNKPDGKPAEFLTMITDLSSQLLAWYLKLPANLSAAEIVYPAELKLQ